MEDLKKLARKFVSDQFAEKIVELIAKAANSLLTPPPNVSEENEANVDDIQKVSDNEVMDPYKGRPRPKLAMRTTPRQYDYDDNFGEFVRPKQVKVNSKYAESDLRSQELTELSEYRNPLKLPTTQPKDNSPVANNQESKNILRQSPLPQYLVSPTPDGDKESIILSNTEKKKPKFAYHKSKTPDKNAKVGAQFASVNIGGDRKKSSNPTTQDDRYEPATEEPDKERKPKILDLQYQVKKDKNKKHFGKVKEGKDKAKGSIGTEKERKQKSEEYLSEVRKLADKEIQEKYKKIVSKVNENYEAKPKLTEKLNSNLQTDKVSGKLEVTPTIIEQLNSDHQNNKDTSKNDTLHMFVKKGGQLLEVTTERERVEFDQYQPKTKHKHASKPRKTKYKKNE